MTASSAGALRAEISSAFVSAEAKIALLAAVGIGLHLYVALATAWPALYADLPLYAVLAVGGMPLLAAIGRRLWRRELGSDVLAGLSILGSIVTGHYLVGTIIVLMYAGGTGLERYATERANSGLAALRKRTPNVAHRKTASGLADVPVGEVRPGDILVVLPHEVAPVDGTVIEGHGRMDESYLTGEPFEISKTPGPGVYSGARNGEDALVIEAARAALESRHAQIVRLFHEAEANRPRMQRLADRLGAWYTLLAVSVAAGAWLVSGDPERFLAVTVIATPCPLLIAIPVAILGAISLAARRGILVKKPEALEQIDQCRILIFDKTGTLTYGKPVLTEVLGAEGISREEALRKAASLEQYSKHPLAAAMLAAAREAGLPLGQVSKVSEKPGQGLSGFVDGAEVRLVGRKHMADRPLPAAASGLECIMLLDGRLAGVFRFRDEPRRESRPFITHLEPSHGARRLILLSGDREEEVSRLAERVSIREIHFGKSPEDKVAIVQEATRQEKTLFVGDGINDAPAMLVATVAVALGSAHDVTSEAAAAVVLDSSLEKVDDLIHIGRRMRRIALQSAVGGILLSLVGMGLAASGLLPPLAGAIFQELIDLGAVLNALRIPFHGRRLADFPAAGND